MTHTIALLFPRLMGAALLLGLAACAQAPAPKEIPATPAASLPSTGGFSPLRAQSIAIPGQGQWTCAPGSNSSLSGCTRATTTPSDGPSARPGLLPVGAVGGPPSELPPEGTPIRLPDFDESAEIPMNTPG